MNVVRRSASAAVRSVGRFIETTSLSRRRNGCEIIADSLPTAPHTKFGCPALNLRLPLSWPRGIYHKELKDHKEGKRGAL
jgi:hypothetical protein